MIYVEMNGRLGNQMFRYAFARMIQIQGNNKDGLCFDFSNIDMENRKREMPGWEDSLRHFNVAPYVRYQRKCDRPLIVEHTTLPEKAVLAIEWAGDRLWYKRRGVLSRLDWRKKFLAWHNRHGIYQTFIGLEYPFTWTPKDKLVVSPCENADYPEQIREVLLEEFTPVYPLLDKNNRFFEKIGSTNSVCVSVRRGNYLQYPMLNVCSEGYYNRAIQKMESTLHAPVFFVFSDDIEWTKSHLHFESEVYFESGSDPVWEKLRLMYSCRHFIIANSTFSWWAQFLGRDDHKTVIAPERWYNSDYQPPLFEKNWTLLKP